MDALNSSDRDQQAPDAGANTTNRILRQILSTTDPETASRMLHDLHAAEVQRIAHLEFADSISPEEASRQLAGLADGVIEAALQFTMRRLAFHRGLPTRADGSHPEVTVIGLGPLGGQEMSYDSPLQLVFLFDAVDPRNVWHRNFYEKLVTDLVVMLVGDPQGSDGLDVDLRGGPKHEVGVPICAMCEAAKIYESSGRTTQRMQFVKARVVAGSVDLAAAFLDRLRPWVYHHFHSGDELAEQQAIQHNLLRRAGRDIPKVENFYLDPGGLADIHNLIVCLQIFLGGHLPKIRENNLFRAITALQQEGCLSRDEAAGLLDRCARLSRLQHQIAMLNAAAKPTGPPGTLPTDLVGKQRLATELGIVQPDNDSSGESGDEDLADVDRFDTMLADILDKNRKLITRVVSDDRIDPRQPADETELLLDVAPDFSAMRAMMRRYGMKNVETSLEHVASLGKETVPFLSSQRCRHAMASVAPQLLREFALTPDPDDTLRQLVRVTDSLGAKAMLWDLLGSSKPTLNLLVRLCATTPLLASILIENPGMIDELVDSLLIDRLPSSQRLDAHSIEICRGDTEIGVVLREFKNSANLMIGVRDMLGKETVESTQAAIADTAQACLRRLIDHQHETAATQHGDPKMICEDEKREVPAELIAVGLGGLGGRELHYQSTVDVLLLYSGDGETTRRLGGRRHTTTNDLFFDQVAKQVLQKVNETGPGGRLYELTSRLDAFGYSDVGSMTLGNFLALFRGHQASLHQWMMLSRARVISGSRRVRETYQQQIVATLLKFNPPEDMAHQAKQLQSDARTDDSEHLHLGLGGAADVEMIAQYLTLRSISKGHRDVRQGTIDALTTHRNHGLLSEDHASTLIRGYRILQKVIGSLCLMNAPDRYRLPTDDLPGQKLAYLMGKPNPDSVRQMCQSVQTNNRAIFDRVLGD